MFFEAGLAHAAVLLSNIQTEIYTLMTSQCNNCIQEKRHQGNTGSDWCKGSWVEKYWPASPKKTFKLSQKIGIGGENPTCTRLRMSSRQAYVAPLFEQVARMILSNHTGSKRVGRCHHHHGKLSRRIANNWRHVRIAAIGESPLCVAGYASRDASTIDTTRSETRKY